MIEILLIIQFSRVNRNSIKLGNRLVTIRQIKAARALLGWSQADLARDSDISEPTIARLESVEGEIGGRHGTAKKILVALEKAGIEFIEENGGGPGVRLRKRQQKKN
jgi:transcriptional regulator with XRE-family HTH domain